MEDDAGGVDGAYVDALVTLGDAFCEALEEAVPLVVVGDGFSVEVLVADESSGVVEVAANFGDEEFFGFVGEAWELEGAGEEVVDGGEGAVWIVGHGFTLSCGRRSLGLLFDVAVFGVLFEGGQEGGRLFL